MQYILVTIEVFLLSIAILMVIYNLLYINATQKAKRELGITLPKTLQQFFVFNILSSIVSALIITFLLFGY